MSKFINTALLAFCLAGSTISARAAYEKEETEIQRLLADGKYESAAGYINSRPELRDEPRFVRLFTHILTTKYVQTINFSLFALKDLKKGERVEDHRGKSGTSRLIGGPLDKLLYDQLKKRPKSPEINFAVGEYISRGDTCGCRQPGPFFEMSGDDAEYFLRAYAGGVADDWSLFRIGVHHQMNGRIKEAMTFYNKALAINPDAIDANYNLAALYHQTNDNQNALRYLEKVLGKYEDKGYSADTYALRAMIFKDMKKFADAEASADQALELKSWHKEAFSTLLEVYRHTSQKEKYVQRAKDFIALDYGNTYTFNAYLDFLKESGQTAEDRRVEQSLLALKLTEARQDGALYFNLARMADMRNDKAEALRRCERSLAAFKTMKEPPEGAIPALTRRIRELGGERENR